MTLAERVKSRSRAERRALALVMLVVGVAVLWSLLLAPLIGLIGAREVWRADARSSIERQRALAAREPALRESLEALNQSPVWARFRRADPDSDPSTTFERDLKALQSATGVSARSFEALPVTEDGTLLRYGATVRASAELPQLAAFLAGLRSSEDYRRVENLRITAPSAGVDVDESEVELSLDVLGYLLVADPPPEE